MKRLLVVLLLQLLQVNTGSLAGRAESPEQLFETGVLQGILRGAWPIFAVFVFVTHAKLYSYNEKFRYLLVLIFYNDYISSSSSRYSLLLDLFQSRPQCSVFHRDCIHVDINSLNHKCHINLSNGSMLLSTLNIHCSLFHVFVKVLTNGRYLQHFFCLFVYLSVNLWSGSVDFDGTFTVK